MTKNRIVALGGGVGGVSAVETLKDRLPENQEIILIDKSEEHLFKPIFLRILTREGEEKEGKKPLKSLEEGSVSFLNSEVTDIDLADKEIKTEEETIPYDYLISSLGVEFDPDAIEGFYDAHHIYDASSARKYKEALETFSGEDIVMGMSRLPYICPAAPVEAALVTDDFLRKFGLREEIDMRFFFPRAEPMKKAGGKVSENMVKKLEERDIAYQGNHKLSEIDPKEKEIRFDGEDSWGYDLLFATPPHKPPTVVQNSDLSDESGWIPVDPRTMETEHEDVYAVGDNTKVIIPSIEKPLPKAGIFAKKQGMVAAHNIANDILNIDREYRFDGEGHCYLVNTYGDNGEANFVEVDFFAEPSPKSRMKEPFDSAFWYWGKKRAEKEWLSEWFPDL